MCAEQREEWQQINLLPIAHTGFDQKLDALIDQDCDNDYEKRGQNRMTLHPLALSSRVSASRRIS
ncbi:hypothetical protein D3C81_2093240 [compost metagenome]